MKTDVLQYIVVMVALGKLIKLVFASYVVLCTIVLQFCTIY